MKVFLLANNHLGWKIATYLKEQGDIVAGVAIHGANKRRIADQIVEAAGVPTSRVFDGSRLKDPKVAAEIGDLGADIALSVLFGYILRPEFISLFPEGVINLHPSFLPYNRGAYPNVWSIVDGTPAGATFHYIDSGIDTGDIIAQLTIPVEPVDTGHSLNHRLELACLSLFVENWPLVREHRAPRQPQVSTEGSYHRTSDVAAMDEIDMDRSYVARELIDILRARTYPPYPGAYFQSDGRKVYVRCQLLYEEELERGTDAVID